MQLGIGQNQHGFQQTHMKCGSASFIGMSKQIPLLQDSPSVWRNQISQGSFTSHIPLTLLPHLNQEGLPCFPKLWSDPRKVFLAGYNHQRYKDGTLQPCLLLSTSEPNVSLFHSPSYSLKISEKLLVCQEPFETSVFLCRDCFPIKKS